LCREIEEDGTSLSNDGSLSLGKLFHLRATTRGHQVGRIRDSWVKTAEAPRLQERGEPAEF
jgi:hypothetical protein